MSQAQGVEPLENKKYLLALWRGGNSQRKVWENSCQQAPPPSCSWGWSWESREAREKNIPNQGRGKEILIPRKRRESNPNHDGESCFMVDHIHLADNLEGGGLVGQEDNLILRWSHLFALQGCGPGRVHTYLPTAFLFGTTSHRLCWKVVRCLTEVPPWRDDNPPFLSPGGAFLHPQAHAGDQPPRDFWRS